MSRKQYFVGLIVIVAMICFAVVQVFADHDYNRKQLLIDLSLKGFADSTVIRLAKLPRQNGVNEESATQKQDKWLYVNEDYTCVIMFNGTDTLGQVIYRAPKKQEKKIRGK